MSRASPVDMRKALETVQALKDVGILFVPIPILGSGSKLCFAINISTEFDLVNE